jgi:hypothetical protein
MVNKAGFVDPKSTSIPYTLRFRISMGFDHDLYTFYIEHQFQSVLNAVFCSLWDRKIVLSSVLRAREGVINTQLDQNH